MFFNLSYLITKYQLNIKGVIHVGGHKLEEQKIYYNNNILNVCWVEGNKDIYNQIKDKRIHIQEQIINYLISDEEKETDFYIMNHTQSSSLLDLDIHKKYYPDISVNEIKKLNTTRLDTLIDNKTIDISLYNMMVLDIQGGELKALKSMGKYLENINYILTEVNFERLYKNCPLHFEITEFLSTFGFEKQLICKTKENWGDCLYIKQ